MEEDLNERAKYTVCSDEQNERIQNIRQLFSKLYDELEGGLCIQSRETSLAITKLEEAQFWAIKGISREK